MVRYIIRRLLWVVVLLFLVSFLTFIIFYTLPSADPAQLRAGRQPNPELVQQIRENLGLNDPWYQQYFHYMKDLVLHFDLGYSYQNNYPVKDQIFDRLPASISLAHRGGRHLAPARDHDRGHLGGQEPDRTRPGDDGAGADRDLRARSTGSASSPSTSSRTTSGVPSLQGRGHLRPVLPGPVAVVRSP